MAAVLETNRGDVLAGFSESVRDFCKEAILVFSPDGVKLYGRDSGNVVIVQYSLPKQMITSAGQGNYSCHAPCIEIGIDTKMVAKCLSSVSCGDLVSFSVNPEEHPDYLMIRCQNPASGKHSNWSVVTPDISEEYPIMRNTIDSCGYNNEITMSSLLFHDMMRDLSKSDALCVQVCCDGGRLVLRTNGRHIKAAFEVKRGNETAHFNYIKSEKDRWPVTEWYSMTNLERVAKAKGVAPNISIYLQPNFPIAFAYKSSVGTLSYIISPKEEDDVIVGSGHSKGMPAPCEEIKGIQPRQRAATGKKRRPIKQSEDDAPPKKRAKETDDEEEDDEEEEEYED